MPNILFTPTLWEDSESNSPPSAGLSFGGGEWFWPSLPPQTTPEAASMTTISATGDGDVVRGYATYQAAAETNCVLQWQLGSGGFDGVTLNDGQEELVEFFTNGDTVTIRAYTDSNDQVGGTLTWVPEGDEPPPPAGRSYNCECDDEYPARTLAQMREFLMIRLGWAAMKNTPLPGVNDTLNAFLQDAQEQLHAEYRLPRMERFFTWDLVEGVRFYDLPENIDVCTKELDPRQLTWVGISDGDDAWRRLSCGIPPESYYSDVTGIPSRYEIRQCIEVWPAPTGDPWKLRIKGYFYNDALTADTDVASVDYQAVQLFALANAKAHYGQPDAPNIMRQAMRYVGNMTAGAHHTRRYVPGGTEWVPPPLPVLTGYPGDP